MSELRNELRDLPSVDTLASELEPAIAEMERIRIARDAVGRARVSILAGDSADARSIAEELARAVSLRAPVPMVNATGVLLHTNLGRAPVSERAANAAAGVASGYANTELDRGDGSRGSRGWHTSHLLCSLTGADAAMVVNNNAAAVMLTLAALAHDLAVPVSRGELIEIGGSYRLPELMRATGARLIEIGTTNRTRLGDYVTAMQVHRCGLVLKVHNANYELTGFVEDVGIRDLSGVADIPVVHDVGSGLLDAATPWLDDTPSWVKDEPGVRQSLEAGSDLVLFSGDKLVGGPQAGIIVGSADLVDRLRRHPLARAVRVDAATDAALNATLLSYVERNGSEIPFWRMATLSPEVLIARLDEMGARSWGTIQDGNSLVGAGSAPSARIPSPILRIEGRQDLFITLMQQPTPILARRDSGDLLLDLRTVDPDDDGLVAEVMTRCL